MSAKNTNFKNGLDLEGNKVSPAYRLVFMRPSEMKLEFRSIDLKTKPLKQELGERTVYKHQTTLLAYNQESNQVHSGER
jgi:hypothetical protein